MAEKILIVDDDVDSLKLIGLMLQRHGYEVNTVNQGSQALISAEADHPDLIILDVMMPDMNGLEVCRRLRENPATSPIPIIMFTAKTLIDDKVKGFEAGADDYLTKPTHPAELASRVKAILSRKQAEDAASPALNKAVNIGVLGVKGGVGTTTVAMNLSAAMLAAGDTPVLMDVQPGAGTLGLMLGATSRGLANVKANNLTDADAIEKEVITHQSGLRALLSSVDPREAQLDFTGEDIQQIARTIGTMGSHIILDLGARISPVNAPIISDLHRLLLVIEANPVALAMARLMCRQLEPLLDADRVSIVVVQRTPSKMQTPWPEIENILNREVIAIIAAAPDLAFRGMQKKMPLLQVEPNAIVPGQFVKLAEDLKSRL